MAVCVEVIDHRPDRGRADLGEARRGADLIGGHVA